MRSNKKQQKTIPQHKTERIDAALAQVIQKRLEQLKTLQTETLTTETTTLKRFAAQYYKQDRDRMTETKKVTLGIKRVPMTVRITPDLKEWFTTWAKQTFGSTCPAIEEYILALKTGIAQQIPLKNKMKLKYGCVHVTIEALTINVQLNVTREVLKHRRLGHERVYPAQPEFSTHNFDMGNSEGPIATRADVNEPYDY